MRIVGVFAGVALLASLAAGQVEAAPQSSAQPAARPPAVVYQTAISIGSSRVAFRGKAGTYVWTDVSISPNSLLVRWDARSTSAACTVKWTISGSSGGSGTIRPAAGKRATGSKTADTSSVSTAKVTVKSTCPRWLITMGPGASSGGSGGGSGGGGGSGCDPNYSGYCVPIVSYDLDCKDIGHSVIVVGVDHHRFDGDGDGVGCESYG